MNLQSDTPSNPAQQQLLDLVRHWEASYNRDVD